MKPTIDPITTPNFDGARLDMIDTGGLLTDLPGAMRNARIVDDCNPISVKT